MKYEFDIEITINYNDTICLNIVEGGEEIDRQGHFISCNQTFTTIL